jgi:hypothetical protein
VVIFIEQSKCVARSFDLTRLFRDLRRRVFGTPPLLTRTGPRKRRLHLPRKIDSGLVAGLAFAVNMNAE